MRRAVCPGSFDPVHKGHIEIIARASNLFDEVIVAVSTNYNKKHLFSEEERVNILAECVGGLRGVTVEPMGQGLLAEFCRDHGAESIVKGLRSEADYQYEVPMATMNRHLTGVETVFLQGDQTYAHVSSSLIKEVHKLGGDISDFVPTAVLKRLESQNFGS
ncbi:pantetheine-phosphate adenylyltransferase [Neomicrococcus lactis]|uniref:pantetheine-phosphate adenylyltransferase n=1 Tax=Neomicrococcus lactis TaxID=732241 RepID=UPI002301B842|nr:pantetheine-phosphate adenylyltransferase [Neomicrococcus lactis]